MQRTLEDEEHYENSLIETDPVEPVTGKINVGERYELCKGASGSFTPKNVQDTDASSGDDDDVSTTEKHDCSLVSHGGSTQDLECTSADRLVRGFGSDIDGVGTAVVPDGDPTDTERVMETESQVGDAVFNERNAALHRCSNIGGETMQLDDEAQPRGKVELNDGNCTIGGCSEQRLQDTENGTVKTADLLASEVAGSWAMSTAPSVNGENESPMSMGNVNAAGEDVAAATLLPCSDGLAAGSQSNVSQGITKLTKEHRALNAMIKIVAPEFEQRFQVDGDARGGESMSDAETQSSNNSGANHDTGQSIHDGNDDNASDSDDTTRDNEMIEDSVC